MLHPDDPEATANTVPRISISDFPPLHPRGPGYWSEPLLGICIVSVLSVLLVGATHGVTATRTDEEFGLADTLVILIWAEAGTAAFATMFLLFAGAGVICRSQATCYPMPAEVEERLRRGQTLEGMDNIKSDGRSGMPQGSYCVRCLVWRRQDAKAHHCNTCQRCVTGFDHHCGVFGRCIVLRNMPCFISLIGMVFAGMVTTMVAVASSSPGTDV